MEIFAQWLDDLDDVVFALALVWESARIRCLELGLLAALLIVSSELARMPAIYVLALSYFAATSVFVWLAGSLGASLYARREPHRA